jgi:hypothetical protein
MAALLGVLAIAIGGGAAAGAPSALAAAPHLRALPVPAGQTASDDFTVRARVAKGPWRDVGVYAARVDLEHPSTASMALVEADVPVQIAVTRRSATMRSLRVRPGAKGVRPTLSADGRTATMTIARPVNLSLEPDGDTHANLQLFVNPIDRGVRARRGTRVIRYARGVHEIPGKHVLRVPSHTTVQIDAGAVVHGTIEIRRATGAVVRGGGVLDPSPYFDAAGGSAGVTVDHSSHVGIQGITILRGQNGGITLAGARDVVVENVKEVNADQWSDGVDITSSRDVLVDGCFLRTSDDSIAIWATSPWAGRGPTRNVTVRDTVLWPDLAHAVLVGPFGERGSHETISELDFRDIDVLEQDEDNPRYQGALALNAGDDLTLRGIRFEDVRIAHVTQGQAVNVRVFPNPDYPTTPGDAVRDVVFRDVGVPAEGAAASVVAGFSPTQTVAGVLFENLRRAGVAAHDAASANLDVGPYANDIAVSGPWAFHVTRTSAVPTIAFSGRRARLIGSVGPTGGRLDVAVDRAYRRTVDTYSGRRGSRRVLFDTGVLAAGRHTLRVRRRSPPNALSTGNRVTVDAVEIAR